MVSRLHNTTYRLYGRRDHSDRPPTWTRCLPAHIPTHSSVNHINKYGAVNILEGCQ